ncbi:MAG: acyl-[ACP]--phospholipid O-acyltransferase [Hyphomicrobiaceae bacterium]
MSANLMTTRRFAPLFWCQFFSALNDNFVKNALVILILYTIGAKHGAMLVTLAGVILIAPFFILSALGGELADRYDKALMARRLKLVEIPVALFAGIGFALHSVPLLMAALGCYGIIGALFGPIKYGILPDHLETKELAAGNALVEGATFLAILLGTVAGGIAAAESGSPWIVAGLMVGLAVACVVAAYLIPPTGAAAPNLTITRNPLTSTWRLIGEVRRNRRIWIGALIVSWFWLVGGVVLALLPTLIKDRVGGSEGVVTSALMVFVVGIAIGSWLAARASHDRPNLALVPTASLLMGIVGLDLAYLVSSIVTASPAIGPAAFASTTTGIHLFIDLCLLALGGGLFVVPSFAAVQAWAEPDRRARVVAAVNVVSAGFIAASGLLVAVLQSQGVSLTILFAALAVANLLVTVLVVRAWRREGVRDVGAFLFRAFYDLEVKGLENLPKAGERMVIAPNHVSLLDGPMLHAVLPVDAAFAIDTNMADGWWVKPFLKLIRAHRIDPTRPLAARTLVNAVKSGEPLVIFPEGRVTVTGGLMKVYDGTAMIADKADAWVVPVRIEGAERTPFGYLTKSQTKKSWFPKVTITILPPEKLQVDPALRGRQRRLAAGAALQDVLVDTAVRTAHTNQTLFEALAEAHAERDTGKPAVEDPLGTSLGYRKLIAGAQVLARKLEGEIGAKAAVGDAVGVMLPNTAGVAVTFFALQSMGRVPAMLNFTAGPANVRSACEAAQVRVVLTSRAFVEKARLEPVVAAVAEDAKILYLEDVRAKVAFGDKVRGFLDGTRPRTARSADDPAVILFTSGSEGTPKGVVLSHRNILANVAQALSRISANGDDKVFNVLPVFHSFGLTGGLMMPLVAGVPVFLYPSPLHYRIVPELIYQTKATILFGTDTFLTGYARSAHPYDLRSVRMIMAGAEAVKERTRAIYMDRFGVRILEGYGVTETAPVLAINTPMANRTGTVGRLSPLTVWRLEPVPGIDEGGRLYVKGPNVMLGYLRAENPGVLEPPPDGWHDTGDIVTIDAQGFVTIKGRAKRFAKIAGEMVSLAAVETLAATAWPSAQSAVVALPDARKGERLALVTTEPGATREPLLRQARARGTSELGVPADVIVVERLPLLGSGKTDYAGVLTLARERLTPGNPAAA